VRRAGVSFKRARLAHVFPLCRGRVAHTPSACKAESIAYARSLPAPSVKIADICFEYPPNGHTKRRWSRGIGNDVNKW